MMASVALVLPVLDAMVIRQHCTTPLHTIPANPSRLAMFATAQARCERRAEQD